MESKTIRLNKNIYSLEVIFSAAYVFLEKAYIKLDEENENIVVNISQKQGQDMQNIEKEFLNELINYSDYKKRAERSRNIREIIIQRAILTNETEQKKYQK